MRAARAGGDGVAVDDVAEPVPGQGQVIVTVERSGICGSDLHMIAEGVTGVTLGHEFAGRLDDGTLVAVRPTGACGACESCARGRINLCSAAFGAFHGGLIDGGWAERVVIDARTAYRVPAGMSAGGAALVEPIAVAVHGVRRIAPESGQRIAVIGGGSVGLAAVAVLIDAGHDVAIEARYRHQQIAAERLGARVGLQGSYDTVVDAVGTQSAVESSVRACRSGGMLLELGVFWEPVSLGRELTLREISLVPALFYAHDHSTSDFEEAIRIMSERPEIESIFVTHTFPLEDVARAVQVAGDRESGAIKVHLSMNA